jgi:hypothetical protein
MINYEKCANYVKCGNENKWDSNAYWSIPETVLRMKHMFCKTCYEKFKAGGTSLIYTKNAYEDVIRNGGVWTNEPNVSVTASQ